MGKSKSQVKSTKRRKLRQKNREINKNINGNILTIKGGFKPNLLSPSEWGEELKRNAARSGSFKDKRNKLREKAFKKESFVY